MAGLEINQRIGLLRSSLELSGKEFAEKIGVKRSTVNNWETGGYNIKADDIENICKKCGVSADWLIGLSDVRSPEADIQAICNYTGLNEEVVDKLHTCVTELKPDNSYFEIVNNLLSHDKFFHVIAYLQRAKHIESQISDDMKSNPEAFNQIQDFFEAISDRILLNSDDSNVRLSIRQGIEFYLQGAVDRFRQLCNSIVKGDSE